MFACIVATNALIDMEQRKITADDIRNMAKSLCSNTPPPPSMGCDPRLDGGIKKVFVSWEATEGRALTMWNTIHMHPVDWCRLIGKTTGYDVALEHLRRYLHQRIDQRFNGIKK